MVHWLSLSLLTQFQQLTHPSCGSDQITRGADQYFLLLSLLSSQGRALAFLAWRLFSILHLRQLGLCDSFKACNDQAVQLSLC